MCSRARRTGTMTRAHLQRAMHSVPRHTMCGILGCRVSYPRCACIHRRPFQHCGGVAQLRAMSCSWFRCRQLLAQLLSSRSMLLLGWRGDAEVLNTWVCVTQDLCVGHRERAPCPRSPILVATQSDVLPGLPHASDPQGLKCICCFLMSESCLGGHCD